MDYGPALPPHLGADHHMTSDQPSSPAEESSKKSVASQLNDYVCSNGLENVEQSAYKLGHSTKTELLSIKNDVHLALARGEATAVVLLDQSAAFDTIDHGTLLGCLSSWFGVSGVVLEWFKSYLSDHFKYVRALS